MRIPAILVRGKDEASLVTEDVSMRGIFLRTEEPPNLRQLVQIKLRLPPTNEEVCFHGMAVHVVKKEQAKNRVAGVGIQFFTADPVQRARWEKFVRTVGEERAKGNKAPALASTPTAINNRRARHDAKIRLWVKSLEHLRQIYTENISKGGLLLATNERMAIGAKLRILIMHPVSKESFDLEGSVRRHVLRDHFKGVAVELSNIDEAR